MAPCIVVHITAGNYQAVDELMIAIDGGMIPACLTKACGLWIMPPDFKVMPQTDEPAPLLLGSAMKPSRHLSFLLWVVCAFAFCACGGGGGGSSTPTYTISGTISAAAGNQVDSDLNDTGTTPIPNNDFASAQAIVAPGVIGGYVNVAGTGTDGNSYSSGDPVDIYRVSLDAGTTVRLTLPDYAAAEVTLTIRQVDQPAGTTFPAASNVVTTVDTSGEYYLEVQADSGATAYRLMVGAFSDQLQITSMEKGVDFVPDEVLVQLRADGSQNASRSAAMTDFSRRTGLKKIHGNARGWMRLRAEDRQTVFQRLNLQRSSASGRSRSEQEERRIAKEETLRLVEALRRQPEVAHAQPNYIRHPYFTPNDHLYPYQWDLAMMHLPEAWDLTTGNATVIVATIDTGILSNHPDLVGKIVPGYDFISDPANAGDGDGPDDDPEDPGDSADGGSSFHGTHVAGTIAAAFNNGIGVAGVGGATRIMPVRVLGREGGTDYDIANAIYWAAGDDVTITNGTGTVTIPGANPPADIINMSLGGADASDVLYDAVADAYAAGVILIAAAGNDGSSAANYPAAYPEVISVSAVDVNASPAYYSNYGPTVAVAAPGGDLGVDLQPDGYADGILSTMGDDTNLPVSYGYGYLDGTSMATAHMSGVAALMKAVRPGLTPDDLFGYLAGGLITADLGTISDDDLYGYGLIDAYQAVVAAGAYDPPTVLSVTPASLLFEAGTDSATLFARRVGSGSLTLNALTVGYDWLHVAQTSGQDPSVGAFGQYTVTVDRSGLPGGVYTDYIEIVTSENTVRVPVTMAVMPDPNASASTQYLQLIDADTEQVVRQLTLTPSDGTYPFVLQSVPPGNYYLLSGSDLNNDYALTDEGEAVGGYPGIGTAFTVDRDMTGLAFEAGFSQWPFYQPSGISASVARRRP